MSAANPFRQAESPRMPTGCRPIEPTLPANPARPLLCQAPESPFFPRKCRPRTICWSDRFVIPVIPPPLCGTGGS
jgi:hypothetical protein